MSRTLILRPLAKINVTLHVGAAGADGFHELRTLFQSVAVADTLVISARPGPFAIAARAPGLAVDRTNLVWRAADALWRALGRSGEPYGAHVKLEKRIPMAAGLGGGSADAAAALVGLNAVWNGRLRRPDLMRIGATVGADVPFGLHGGTAMGLGRGDELYPVDDITRFGVVLLKPSFGVATADAYRWLDEDRRDVAGQRQTGAPHNHGADTVDVGWGVGGVVLANDLQAPVTRRHPEIAEMAGALRRAGAIGAAMTGSGSAVFGLFTEAAALAATRRLKRPDWLVVLTRTASRREAARHLGL